MNPCSAINLRMRLRRVLDLSGKRDGSYPTGDLGSVRMETLVRDSVPISPMNEPSRAKTSDDCFCGTICQGSPVEGACAASGSAPASANTRGVKRIGGKLLLRNAMVPLVPRGP